MMERKRKNSYLNVLLIQNGMREYKFDFLSGYGVKSTLDLSDEQIDDAITRLQNIKSRRVHSADVPVAIRRLRSAIILTAEDYLGFKISSKPTWESFNRLMLSKKIGGKMLWEMTEIELKTVLKKLKKIARHESKERERLNFLSKLN